MVRCGCFLLFGLVVAGLLRTFVDSDRIGRHLKGQGFLPIIKAALLGIPLPLCSCGVIPAAIGLRRAGLVKKRNHCISDIHTRNRD
ncbi:permease [Vibrio sp. PP-XX7]